MTTESNATKRKDLFLIDPRNIVVEDGFNVRIDFDLDELKEQIKAAKAAIKDAKSQGKATASNKEVSQHLKDTKEVGNMIATIYRLQAYLNGEDQIQLSVLLKQLQHSATLSQAIRQYFYVISQNKKTE